MYRSNTSSRWIACLVVPAMAIAAAGCRSEMYNQPKAEPLEQSLFFADSQASRPFVTGTVPRGSHVIAAPDGADRDTRIANRDSVVATDSASRGALRGDSTSAPASAPRFADARAIRPARGIATSEEIRMMSIPTKVTRAMLDRGRERYDIYCAPCHGRTGDGNGMIVQRGFPQPPSLHLDRLRTAADGHYYDVITNGFGAMFRYANRVKPDDRWAITAYIRALQFARSPDTPLSDSRTSGVDANADASSTKRATTSSGTGK